MIYKVVMTAKFARSFKKLDRSVQIMIKMWIEKNLINTDDPRLHGKPLSGNLSKYWQYRIGDYRLLAEINDDELIIVAVNIGHRKEIYK